MRRPLSFPSLSLPRLKGGSGAVRRPLSFPPLSLPRSGRQLRRAREGARGEGGAERAVAENFEIKDELDVAAGT